jgi:hypothetical protein
MENDPLNKAIFDPRSDHISDKADDVESEIAFRNTDGVKQSLAHKLHLLLKANPSTQHPYSINTIYEL